MAATIAIRANLNQDSVTTRNKIKMAIAENEGRAIGRVSDSLVIERALEAYWKELQAKAS